MPLCLAEKLECVSNIMIDKSDCLQQCSGLLVTSYDQQDIENGVLNLVDYLNSKVYYQSKEYRKDVSAKVKGLSICTKRPRIEFLL